MGGGVVTFWAVILAGVAISSASERGFHAVPDGSIMLNSDMKDAPAINLDLNEESVPEGQHLMADGSLMHNSDMDMDAPTIEENLDGGTPAGYHLMADSTVMKDSAADEDEELENTLGHRFGSVKKMASAASSGLKKAASSVTTAVKSGVKKVVKEVKHKALKWALSMLPDKNKERGLPAQTPVKKTWSSWADVIQANFLCAVSYTVEATANEYLSGCRNGFNFDGAKWNDKLNAQVCTYFKNHRPFTMRKFLDQGDWGAKHTSVEAFVATTASSTTEAFLDEIEVQPLSIIERAEKEAAAARRAAAAAAEYAKNAFSAAQAAKSGTAKPKDKPVAVEPKATVPKPLIKPTPTSKPAALPASQPTADGSKITTAADGGKIWVAFRGSQQEMDWIQNFEAYVTDWPYGSKVGRVHKGFLNQYSQAREAIKTEVMSLIAKGYRNLFITGHSLGGALAELCAMDAVEYTKDISGLVLTMTNFGAPCPGDNQWVANFDRLVLMSTRIVNDGDVVPCLPGELPDVSMLNGLVQGIKGILSGDASRTLQLKSHLERQVATRLMYARGRWFHDHWPKCNVYAQAIEDHSIENAYLPAVLAHQPTVASN